MGEALSWLESHVNLETIETGAYRTPTLERISELCALMGDPQNAYPSIHVTGTNGKGSVARMVSDVLSSAGLSVGTYTSPDLEGINERFAHRGVPVDNGTFTDLLESLKLLEPLMAEVPSRFEILTAAAFRWFADLAVDVAVVEVGLGGKWDATNVIAAQVAVVTNVDLDHVDILGPTRQQIAAEKSGIVKKGSTLVLGETDPGLIPIFSDAVAANGAEIWCAGEHFDCKSNEMVPNGRLLDLSVPGGEYDGIFVPLHGSHQGTNAAVALASVDAFFGGSLGHDVVRDGFANVVVPGRLEIVSRSPLVVLDGAHNPAGAACAGEALDEEFAGSQGRVVVIGLLKGRDPREMLECLGPRGIETVIACPAPSPRTQNPDEIVAAARSLGIDALSAQSVADGVARAVYMVSDRGLVLVTGSMYVVGAARTELLHTGSLKVR